MKQYLVKGKVRICSAFYHHVFLKWMTIFTRRAFQKDTVRNQVIICDHFIEKDTAPMDGFVLFRYLLEQPHAEIEPYYVMHQKSAQYPQMKAQYGNRIIGYDETKRIASICTLAKHFQYTKFLCDGYTALDTLQIGLYDAVKRSKDAYVIFTQHGVNFFKESFLTAQSFSAFRMDKVMVSNAIEQEMFLRRGCFRAEDCIQNGLFRWDLLSLEPPKKPHHSIFIYFTHRRYLQFLPDLQSSTYVRSILALLTHPKLKALAEETGSTIEIGLHHSLLDVCGSDVFQGFHLLSDAEIAEAKRRADVLITDYSSMCFEMWFQHKPVIFLRIPDQEECLRYQQPTDLPDPYQGKEQYLFGLTDSVDACVAQLEQYMQNSFTLSAEETAKRDAFFFYESDFCARFYKQLLCLREQQKPTRYIPLEQPVPFSRCPDFETEGLELPCQDGRWMTRKKAKIAFYVPTAAGDLTVSLSLFPLLQPPQNALTLRIDTGQRLVGRFSVTEDKPQQLHFQIPRAQIAADGYVELSVRTFGVYRQNQITANAADRRHVSICFVRMTVQQQDLDQK